MRKNAIKLVGVLIAMLGVAGCGDGGDSSGTPGDTKTSSKTVDATAGIFTKAKVYLGIDDVFTISNSGTTLYGGAGNDTVTIADGVSSISLDQNIERINFFGVSGSYAFKQTGNKINVYDATGATLLVSVPVQGDSDGTVLSFSDGAASALLTSGVMTLGGTTVSAGSATTLAPGFNTSTTTVTVPATTTTTTTKTTSTTTTVPTGSVTVRW